MFIKNAWYVVGRQQEINRDPVQHIVCQHAMVFFRKENGEVVALRDQCPHRKFALSKGRVVGDEIQCMYHGLKFDCTGACTYVPGQDSVPAALQATSYPVVERYGWVWVWPGDPKLADESLMPDYSVMEQEGWVTVYGGCRIKANYQLILDNIMDLTHVGYVHLGTIGTEEVAEAPMDVQVEKNSVRFQRYINDAPVPKTFNLLRDDWPETVDRWQKEDYLPPSSSRNDVRAVPAGSDDEARGFRYVVMNHLRPISETETYYHWGVTRGFQTDNQAVSEELRKQIVLAFEQEDKDAIEIQQQMIDLDNTDTPLRAFQADKTTLGVRRIVRRLLDEESTIQGAS